MKKLFFVLTFLVLSISVFAAALSATDQPLINAIKALIVFFQVVAGLYCVYQGIEGAMKMSGNGDEGKRHLTNALIGFLIVLLLWPITNMLSGHAKTEGKADTSNIDSVLK
jgi:hypothetical protein